MYIGTCNSCCFPRYIAFGERFKLADFMGPRFTESFHDSLMHVGIRKNSFRRGKVRGEGNIKLVIKLMDTDLGFIHYNILQILLE